MEEVCRACAGEERSVFLYGSTADTLDRLAANLVAKVPGLVIAGTRPSRFDTTTAAEQQEIQMLAISRALLAKPTIMLLDEPSLGLSPKLTREIFEIIVRINRERGVTLLVVEQNARVALKYADFGYVLEVGRIVMEDPCAVLREKEDIKEFYLGIKESGVRGTRRWKKKKTWR